VYRGTETFCLSSPLSGRARYSVRGRRANLTLDIRGLLSKTSVGLDWINNPRFLAEPASYFRHLLAD
jgi:hypothetical protein